MKIAVCLAGNLRSFRETAKTWDDLRSKHDVQFFASIWDTIESVGPAWHSQDRPNRILTRKDKKDFFDLYSPTIARISKNVDCDPIESQWRLVGDSFTLAEESQQHFDIVIRSRPDAYIHWLNPYIPAAREIVCTQRAVHSVCDATFFGDMETMKLATAVRAAFPHFLEWRHGHAPEEMFAEYCRRRFLLVTMNRDALGLTLIRRDGSQLGLTA